jgi:MFS family permease
LALDSCDWKKKKINSWQIVLTRKDFALYLFPWIMFSITGGLSNLVESELPKALYTTATTIGYELHYLGWAVFGFMSGIMADRVGRRQPIIIGLVMLGVSLWILSLFTNPLTVIIFELFSGIAWGILFTVYITVLGDLAFEGSRERFYALGAIMPIVITLGVQAIVTSLGISIPREILTPILSIALFASILPVLRASETLSSARIISRKMKEHVEKVGKLVKESKKE